MRIEVGRGWGRRGQMMDYAFAWEMIYEKRGYQTLAKCTMKSFNKTMETGTREL